MKKIIILFFMFFTFVLSESKMPVVNLGFLYQNIYVSQKEAGIAFKAWINKLEKRTDIKINVKFYEDQATILEDYLDKKTLDTIMINPVIFLKNRAILKRISKKYYTFQIGDEKYIKYYLIKNKKIKKDISKRLQNLDIVFNAEDSAAKLWFDKYTLENFGKPYRSVVSKEINLTKQIKVIYEVFFNQNTLAVVSNELYDTAVELNPQLKKDLEIISQSPRMFSIIFGMFNKNLSEETMMKLTTIINEFNTTAYGQDILAIASLNKVVYITDDELKKYEKFYKEYLKLKNQYRRK